jgi:hypothetical protein
MDALVIGAPGGLADAITRSLRRAGEDVLQATPADAADPARAAWLLAEARSPARIFVVEAPPFAVARGLLPLCRGAQLVLVAEQRVAVARAGAARARSAAQRALRREALAGGLGFACVPLGRAGRRWVVLGGAGEALGADRAAALALRSCGARSASAR